MNGNQIRAVTLAALMVFSVFAFAVPASAQSGTSVDFDPSSQSVSQGGTATYDVVVGSAPNGVSTYSYDISTSDASNISITDFTFAGSPSSSTQSVTFGANNGTLNVTGGLAGISGGSNVVIGTVEVTGAGSAGASETLSIDSVNSLLDSGNSNIAVSSTGSATASISQSTSPGSGSPTAPSNTNEGTSYIGDDTPDAGFADNNDLSGSTVWQGQEIVVDLSTVAGSNAEVQLQRVQSFGSSDGNSVLAQQLTTDSQGILTIDTADQQTGDYFLTGNATLTSGANSLPTSGDALGPTREGVFSINEQTLSAIFDDETRTTDGQNTLSDDFEFDSNRGTYPITVHASGDLDTDELRDIFVDNPGASFNFRYAREDDDGETDYDEIGLEPVSDADDYAVDFSDIDAGSYEFTFVGTDSTATSTDSIEVTESDANVDFEEGTSTDPAGDIMEFHATFEDTDDGFIQIGDEESDFVDVLYLEEDDDGEPVEVEVNTRLLGTDVPEDRVYSTDNANDIVSAMHFESGSSGNFVFNGSTGNIDIYGDDGASNAGNFTDYLAAMDLIDDPSESKYNQLIRPVQPTDYQITAGGFNNLGTDEAVFDADAGGEANDELGSKVQTLTAPEIGEITTHTAPEAAADDETNVSELVDVATPTDEVAVDDRLIAQVEMTGIFGALVDGAENRNTDFDRLDDGVDTDVMQNITEIASEQVTFEVTADSSTGNQDALEVDLSASDQNTFLVLDEENGQLFLVVDTSSDDAFTNGDAPDSATDFTVNVEYDADNDDDRFEFDSKSSPDPYTPEDGAANYPYLAQGEVLSNSADLTVAPRSITFDNLNDNLVVEATASEESEISATTNVAPGSDATLRISSSDASSSFRQGNDVTISEDGSITTTYDLADQEVGDEFDLNFRVAGGSADSADGIIVESVGTGDDEPADDGETNETDTDDGEDMDDGESEPADDGETNESTADDGETESTDDGTPGFGAVVALIALIGAALLAVRRQN